MATQIRGKASRSKARALARHRHRERVRKQNAPVLQGRRDPPAILELTPAEIAAAWRRAAEELARLSRARVRGG